MRIRITFSKQGALRYTGHLDLHKILERSIRRAALPLSYSLGYHPQPRLSLAAALPLGFASRAEVMDIWLDEEVEGVVSVLQANVPPGLTVLKATKVDERAPSLQSQVVAAEYMVEILEEHILSPAPGAGLDVEEHGPSTPARPAKPGQAGAGRRLEERIASLLASDSLPRERRGKKYDLRPLIEALTLTPLPGGEGLFMRLTAREGATGRPEEVLDELGIPLELCRVERTALIFEE